jgi:hypothetical protein
VAANPTTPRGRIPPKLWARAAALTATFSVTRVAKQLGLTPQALKRRCAVLQGTLAPTALPSAPHFVEAVALWRTPATEVEVHRPDGTRLRISYSDPTCQGRLLPVTTEISRLFKGLRVVSYGTRRLPLGGSTT